MDRSELNRALARALAYKQCGKDADADRAAAALVGLLLLAGIDATGGARYRGPVAVSR